MAELAAGSVFAGYRIEEVAGRGGMGVVYRATQLALNRPAALKLIAPELADDDAFRARFKRESEIAASIDHPNVIPVYEAGEAEERLFITMRYVDGTDLSALIQREGRLEPEHAIRIVEQIGAALDAAHKRGLVHRDIKPANVLISEDEQVYLTDFGLTKQTTSVSGLTKTGQFIGTLDYVPPEQIEGKRADARADVYSLGCVLYHELTGKRPYERDSDVAIMYAHLSDPPPTVTHAVPDVPPGLDDVIERAMAKKPDERYPSAGDLARAAQQAVNMTVAVPRERSVATGMAAPGATGAPGPGATVAGEPGATVAGEPGATALPGGPPMTRAAGAAATGEAAAERTPPSAPAAPIEKGAKPRPRTSVVGIALAGALAVVAVVLLLAVAGVLGGGEEGGGEEGGAGGGGELAAVESIEVGKGPDGVFVGGGDVWVSNSKGDTITRIDPASDELAGRPIPVGGNPDGILYADDAVWVANTDDGTVSRIDAGGSSQEIAVGSRPVALALADVNVWVANSGDGTVTRIDRETAAVRGPAIPVGDTPAGLFIGPESVWVANLGDGTVARINRRSNEMVTKPIPVGSQPRGILQTDEGTVWVVNQGDDNVSRIDPSPGRVVGKPIPVGASPKEIVFAAGLLWVTNEGDGTVTRIDPGTGEVVGDPIEVGSKPRGIAAGEGAVWVANSGDDTITKIEP